MAVCALLLKTVACEIAVPLKPNGSDTTRLWLEHCCSSCFWTISNAWTLNVNSTWRPLRSRVPPASRCLA